VPRVRARAGSAAGAGEARRPAGAGGKQRSVHEQRAVYEARRAASSASCAGAPAEQLVEIQRSRLLVGAIGAIEEFGYANVTVGQITSRARVSRRTFYELFGNREACLTALVEEVAASIEGELAAAGLAGLGWRERVRGGLWVILSFFDREPVLARICVVQALGGGPRVLELREALLGRLADAVDEGRGEGARGAQHTPLTAEGLVGAAFAIVYARLLREERASLTDLQGELMSSIVLPYLGASAARREQARAGRAPAFAGGDGSVAASAAGGVSVAPHGSRDPLQEVPMRLTYRTARVLECIAGRPGVSNRGVADLAGVADPGQISKLLARLERLGLTANTGLGHTKGEPNAWELTPLGRQVAQRLRMDTGHREEAA
jgi:AcrR family transcriptional regulator